MGPLLYSLCINNTQKAGQEKNNSTIFIFFIYLYLVVFSCPKEQSKLF